MISFEIFNKSFMEWYFANKIDTDKEEANKHNSDMIDSGLTICYDDIFEDEEFVVTNVLRCTYLNSTETVSGEIEVFRWVEVKIGIKDANANIVRCKTIGYNL